GATAGASGGRDRGAKKRKLQRGECRKLSGQSRARRWLSKTRRENLRGGRPAPWRDRLLERRPTRRDRSRRCCGSYFAQPDASRAGAERLCEGAPVEVPARGSGQLWCAG